ncbi:RluA family pseudouridine synthase, partial [Epilithonimonas sp.]|uniref:RluA family pseudouridine synthase n=1 Tax=Epilithonimonas sp. TaxID=2894511 RepID=UPI00289887DF
MLDENEDFLENEFTDDDSSADENSGLFEHLNIKVDKNQEPLRIDKFLLIHRQNSSRNKISQTCRAGNVVVNGNPVKQNYRVKPGDEISVLLAHPPRENVIIPQDIPINIVYEDDDLVVVDKDPGMVVHPGFGNWDGTLVNALAFHFSKDPNYNSDLDRVGLVHRIDKDTSGLLVIAKNEYALSHLAKQFFDRKTKRLYWAFVWGNVQDDVGTVTGHIGRHPKNRMQMYTYVDGSHGKHAV